MEISERIQRLNTAIETGTLIRGRWTAEENGRRMACLLTTLAPEVGEGNYNACPADLIPEWFARLLPWIDDSGTRDAWPGHMKRFAMSFARPEFVLINWFRFERRCKLAALREAMVHTKDEKILKVCNDVLALLNRSISGDEPMNNEWAAAAAAAWAAAAWAAAASAASTDRIIVSILTALEEECASVKT